VRTVRNTRTHCVGRMQNFGMLKWVVHIVTSGFKGLTEVGMFGGIMATKLVKIRTLHDTVKGAFIPTVSLGSSSSTDGSLSSTDSHVSRGRV
jgi:hypothetical protein